MSVLHKPGWLQGMVQSMLLRLVFGTLSLRHHQFDCGYINTRTRKQRKHFVALVNFGKNCSLPRKEKTPSVSRRGS